jgi:hypothetical protein
MPGRRLRSFRLGDRSELLVQHLLTGFAFTTPVPRQEDIGIDFLCSLIAGEEDDKRLLRAGPFFTVQAKSKGEHEIVYDNLDWISNQENPMLICIADRAAAAMDVYSTWNLLCGVLGGWRGQKEPTRIVLRPGDSDGEWPFVRNEDDGSQSVLLGKPIIRVRHDDIFDECRTENITKVVGTWIVLDRINIVNRHAGLNWVLGPLAYETGEVPDLNLHAVWFAWNPENLMKCRSNLAKSATALWRVLTHGGIAGVADVSTPPWPAGMRALRELLRWCCEVEPNIKSFVPDLDDVVIP